MRPFFVAGTPISAAWHARLIIAPESATDLAGPNGMANLLCVLILLCTYNLPMIRSVVLIYVPEILNEICISILGIGLPVKPAIINTQSCHAALLNDDHQGTLFTSN